MILSTAISQQTRVHLFYHSNHLNNRILNILISQLPAQPSAHDKPPLITTMKPILLLLLCAVVLTILTLSLAKTAYPTVPDTDAGDCSIAGGDITLIPVRREVYGGGRIFDISHRYTPNMPMFESDKGLGAFLWFPNSMKNGSSYNGSMMKLSTHTGTHVDAPGHFYDHYFDAGFDIDTLDLEVLNGN